MIIDTALRLPAPEVEALIQGRMIAAMPRIFIEPGRQFVIYPSDTSINPLPVERYYRSDFLPIAQLGSETISIKAWAKCELCQILNDAEAIETLSRLTVWTVEALQETLSQRGYIFLTYLRVYQLPQPIQVRVVQPKGQFVALPNSLTVTEAMPVLSDRIFSQRKRQLENRQPPLHPELEELQSVIARMDNPEAGQVAHRISQFLGWASVSQAKQQPAWITTIADLGNRSKELDEEKSNYQAGTDFENIVRRSLEFLGFTIAYAHKGGAGGLDLFCSKPYALVGECKAGKSIPNTTAVQLLNLGTLRLNKEDFNKSAKLIIGPGEPTGQFEAVAKIQSMAIINPETLEKLVKLQSKYSGSVDLFKLKDYLKPGSADDEVEKYIAQVETEIRLRSHLVQLVKKHLENTGDQNVGVDALHGAYGFFNPPTRLQREAMYEILIELSSPLTGYLGRIKASYWTRDRFYFLRDLT